MKIAVFSTKRYDKEYLQRYNDVSKLAFTYYEDSLNEDTVHLTKNFDGICVFVNDRLNEEILTFLAKQGIKIIALRCAGFNNVDLKVAQNLGIRVVRVPAYSPEAVAEHALAMILTLNRKTHKAYNRVREGNFSLVNLMGFNLHNKTVGVIGLGQIGFTFCRIMKGLGCRVLSYDLVENSAAIDLGIEPVDLDTLATQSDIISLHCPLTADTHHLIDETFINKLKAGVMIINTGRGGLIDTKAVIQGLKKQKIGYLGLDVYEQEEKLFFQDLSESIIKDELIMRLISFPNVLITSHQAFFTHEAMQQISTITIQSILDFEEGRELENEIAFQ